jgi:hypothetical protein
VSDIDVKKLLDPTGPEAQAIVHGTRIQGRVAVTVYWDDIENALRSGLSITAIYQLLHRAGKVSVTLQAFSRQVKARREGTRAARVEAKPAGEVEASQALASRGGSREPTPPPAESDQSEAADKAPAGPRPSWLTEPPPATNRHAVYKPPDPKKTKT